LAIGAVVALFATFFGAAPASYATTDGAYIDVRPLSNADLTNFGGLLTEDFPIYAQLKPGSANANSNFSNTNLLWEVTYVSGVANILAVATTTSATVGAPEGGISDATTMTSTSAQIAVGSFLVTGDTVSNIARAHHSTSVGVVTVTLSAKVNSAGVAPLFLRAQSTSAFTSVSQNAVYDVRVFIDELGGANGKYDSGEWFTTKRVTLYASSRVAPTVTLGSPARGDTVVTTSATLTTLNWTNLNGNLFLQVEAGDTTREWAGTSTYQTVSPAISGTTANARAGVVSFSFALSGSQTLVEVTRVYAGLRYLAGSASVNGGVLLGSASTSALVSAPGVDTLSLSATANANILGGSVSYEVRPNQTYTIRVTAATASASVSTDVKVTITGTSLVTTSRMISINGGAFLTAYPADGFTVKTGTNGVGTFTIATTGFENDHFFTLDAFVGNISTDAVTFNTAAPTYTVVEDNSLVATAPGTSVNLGFTVEDQWGELSSRTDQFLKVTRNQVSPFNYTTSVSYHAVVAGAATVAFLPQPATATGSATLEVDVVRLENGAYLDNGVHTTVTVTVTSNANSFTTGLAASRAASVSYFPNTVSWVTVTGKVAVTGSAVTVTGNSNLIFRASADLPATTSGTITVRSNAGSSEYSFQVASRLTGTQTMTLTNGTATTTSLLVVAKAASDMGSAFAWDTSTIESGKTRVVIGTLTDANGNPVDTTGVGRVAGDSGTASIVVTYTGTAGIVVGTMPTETDADGKFRVSVLTAAADSGTLTITAVYMPQGSTTVAANQITSVQSVTVAPAAAPEVNAVIGSFNGRWAVRVENAKGSVVSVKAGSRWVKFTSLNNNYLFSRKSVVGRTLAVSVWVDGELQNSQTITIK